MRIILATEPLIVQTEAGNICIEHICDDNLLVTIYKKPESKILVQSNKDEKLEIKWKNLNS